MMQSRWARLVLMVVLALCPSLAARAETSAWVDNEGGRMRLTTLAAEPDGTVKGLLEIEPKPGWVTYWREPGESGIPPSVTVTGGTLRSIAYPVPKVLKLGTLTDIGYDSAVALPLALDKASAGADLAAFIGVCNEICIPFQAMFRLGDGHASPSAEEVARMKAAEASLPGQPDQTFAVRQARLSATTLDLQLAVPDPTSETEAIVTGPEGYVFTARGTGVSISVPLPALPGDRDPKTYGWRAVLKNGGRAIETGLAPG